MKLSGELNFLDERMGNFTWEGGGGLSEDEDIATQSDTSYHIPNSCQFHYNVGYFCESINQPAVFRPVHLDKFHLICKIIITLFINKSGVI